MINCLVHGALGMEQGENIMHVRYENTNQDGNVAGLIIVSEETPHSSAGKAWGGIYRVIRKSHERQPIIGKYYPTIVDADKFVTEQVKKMDANPRTFKKV